MARIVIPINFHDQQKLFTDIIAKHTADGAGSVLITFFTEQDLDPVDMGMVSAQALTHDNNFNLFTKEAEDLTEKRNLLFTDVMDKVRQIGQFLKSLYKPNVQQVGNFGFAVNESGKIVYPPEFIERHTLCKAIKTKHDTYAAGTSPLEVFLTEQDFTIADFNSAVDAAKTHHDNSHAKQQAAENATEQRDLLWLPLVDNLRDIGDFLKKLYPDNPRKLGSWGFTVDDSPQQPVLRTSKLLPLTQKVIRGVIIGSDLKNTGEIPLNIHRGEDTSEPPTTVPPGQVMVVLGGHSLITAANTSATVTARLQVMVHA
jgi:hypothetical protein